MVLSYYIATQTFEEHLEFESMIYFFYFCFFYCGVFFLYFS